MEGIESERTVLFRQAEVFSDLRGERGALCLFFQKLRIDGRRLRIVGVRGASRLGVLFLPAVGGVEIDEGDGNLFFCAAALGADVMDNRAHDSVAHDDLVAAVLEDEAGAVRSRVAGLDRGGVLRECEAGRSYEKKYASEHRGGDGPDQDPQRHSVIDCPHNVGSPV